jgi:hypothetical protein
MNGRIAIAGGHLVDAEGRVAHLRGVNLSGSSKVPMSPDGSTWNPESLLFPDRASFVGRPFPLDQADEHFARLKSWGLTFLRFLVTWEAIEHEGPGRYDEAYLDYLRAVVEKAAGHGLLVLIDPHQDVWSRLSGGDGAPAWTFDQLGMDVSKFDATEAAVTHQAHPGLPPPMLWISNYWKYACATLWTLFFGGNSFAPKTRIDGVPVQEFLQSHYLAAVGRVADRLKGLRNVVGYDTLNEPSQGYIGHRDLNRAGGGMAAFGTLPTFFEGMVLAAGWSLDVARRANPLWPFARKIRVNESRQAVWKDGHQPIWREHGVWDIADGKPRLLKPDYFAVKDGGRVDFDKDFLSPFIERFGRAIRSVDAEALIFVSPPPRELRVGPEGISLATRQGVVYAPHFYDGAVLGLLRYFPWIGVERSGRWPRLAFGRRRRRRLIADQIGRLAARGRRDLGAPTLIGEVGIPFNLKGSSAYQTGDFSEQARALDDSIQGLEANLVSFTLWNYTPDNTNAQGDRWNGEDLSIYSQDQPKGRVDLDDGGRALDAVIRPYAARTPGTPSHASFDIRSKVFRYSFLNDPKIKAPLEVFLPKYHYSAGCAVNAPLGRTEIDIERQTLRYFPNPEPTVHSIVVRPS